MHLKTIYPFKIFYKKDKKDISIKFINGGWWDIMRELNTITRHKNHYPTSPILMYIPNLFGSEPSSTFTNGERLDIPCPKLEWASNKLLLIAILNGNNSDTYGQRMV